VASTRSADKVNRGGGGLNSRRWQAVEKPKETVAHTRERGEAS
jgi:hypothetical protein